MTPLKLTQPPGTLPKLFSSRYDTECTLVRRRPSLFHNSPFPFLVILVSPLTSLRPLSTLGEPGPTILTLPCFTNLTSYIKRLSSLYPIFSSLQFPLRSRRPVSSTFLLDRPVPHPFIVLKSNLGGFKFYRGSLGSPLRFISQPIYSDLKFSPVRPLRLRRHV